jgi:glycerol 3-phosphatase-2
VLADPYDAILLDLDGVLYRWPEPIAGASGAVATLRKAGKRIAFVTNNSSRTPAQVADRLASVEVDAKPEEVVTSALATATVLAERGVRSAFVVGEEGLLEALDGAGIRVVDGSAHDVDVVVVGFDRGADYTKLKDASVLVRRGAPLIASNADASFPAPGGESWPGAGALLAVIETTTGTRGEIVGKPEAPLLERALASAGGGRPLIVGDRMDTDIAGASRLGWDSALVLTGTARREDAEGSPWKPTFVAKISPAWCDGTAPRGAGVSCRRTFRGTADRTAEERRKDPMVLDDIRKTFDAVIGQLSPAKAQQLAKRYMDPGAAKDQVAKTAGELVQLSQRLREAVRKEVTSQMRSMGAATQGELDALRRRVRDLERAAGMTASSRTAGRKTAGRKTAARKPSSRKRATRKTSSKSTGSRRKSSSAS